jgi:hypothetical protein
VRIARDAAGKVLVLFEFVFFVKELLGFGLRLLSLNTNPKVA